MTNWLALLRAVNVGGRNRLPMAELRDLVVELGHTDPATHLQSGNLLFGAPAVCEPQSLADQLRQAIAERFEIEIAVIMRSHQQVADVLEAVPWDSPSDAATGVVFCDAAVNPGLDFARFEPDRAVVIGSDVHVDCPTGFGKTKLTVAWIEKQAGVAGTRRNLKTVRRLHAMLAERS